MTQTQLNDTIAIAHRMALEQRRTLEARTKAKDLILPDMQQAAITHPHIDFAWCETLDNLADGFQQDNGDIDIVRHEDCSDGFSLQLAIALAQLSSGNNTDTDFFDECVYPTHNGIDLQTFYALRGEGELMRLWTFYSKGAYERGEGTEMYAYPHERASVYEEDEEEE